MLEDRRLLTDVGGPVSGQWTLAASPYTLIGDAWVVSGATLTIDSGVQVVTDGTPRDLEVRSGATLDNRGATFTIDDLFLVHPTKA